MLIEGDYEVAEKQKQSKDNWKFGRGWPLRRGGELRSNQKIIESPEWRRAPKGWVFPIEKQSKDNWKLAKESYDNDFAHDDEAIKR